MKTSCARVSCGRMVDKADLKFVVVCGTYWCRSKVVNLLTKTTLAKQSVAGRKRVGGVCGACGPRQVGVGLTIADPLAKVV